ncbi:cysteine desulfurase family protein [Chryseobacterium indologenes]|uniref:cysteine desulfurase family protein n=1 Tax=Chryseobacterium indologenes TaxID=253 RepID=UPI0010245606|nr:cysteine desulfurase family protein [Chryseobacterium indologenes]VFA44198.1 Cysteine desulfurase [Chryseobacterium indologenes]
MNGLQDIIYLDNNATTQIDSRVWDVMVPFLKENYANPSSTHYFGTKINEAVKTARTQIADFIGADENEVIFTSGATEAINIALKGITESYSKEGKHIITVSTEHKAVLDTCKYLETKGYEVTYLPVQKDGLLDLIDLKKALRVDTILVCVMYVNNETGVIQPIQEIASLTHDAGAIFMTDATQAAGKIEIDVDDLVVDLLCLSGHKMYASKGIGALYVRKGIKLSAYTHGGGHENGLRSGTLNVPGIVALGKACEIAEQEITQDNNKIAKLRSKLEKELLEIPETFVNGSTENRIYNVSNICFRGYDANVMIGRMRNIAVSNGSACTSAVIEPSHVLIAMGLNDDDAFASLRFSLGKFSTEQEIKTVVKTISELTKTMVGNA